MSKKTKNYSFLIFISMIIFLIGLYFVSFHKPNRNFDKVGKMIANKHKLSNEKSIPNKLRPFGNW